MIKLTQDQVKSILVLVQFHCANFGRDEIIKRNTRMDKAYHMELKEEILSDGDTNKKEHEEYTRRYTAYDIPLTRKQLQSEIPFLEDIFLGESHIFRVNLAALDPNLKPIADAINKKVALDAETSNWRMEISKFLYCGAKYNLCALEVLEGRKVAKGVLNGYIPASELKSQDVEWTGNKLFNIDPYNMFFDQSVEPYQVSESGEFAGYVTRMSATRLHELYSHLQNLKSTGDKILYLINSKLLWNNYINEGTTEYNMEFRVPEITDNPKTGKKSTWSEFFSDSISSIDRTGVKGIPTAGMHHEILKMYIRIVPETLGINDKELKSTTQVWAVYIKNGDQVIAIESVTNAHGMIPIAVSTPDVDNLGTQGKSSLDCTIEMQKLGGELVQRRLAAIARSIDGREVIDSRYLDASMFETAIPNAKYKTKASFRQNASLKISDLVHQIPFVDTSSQLLTNEMGFIIEMAQQTNLSNASRTGQFSKGNKTPDEVRQTLSNAEAPLIRRAQQFELQGFRVIKLILQFLYVQNENLQQFIPAQPEGATAFDPKTLLTSVFSFQLAGGLSPLSILMNSGALNELFNLIATSPELNQDYDSLKIFGDAYYSRGFDIERYRRTIDPNQTAQE